VKVHFFDINGPKGGIDKRCRISIKLKTSGQLVVLNERDHYIEALSNCLDRLVRSIRREIERKRHSPIRRKKELNPNNQATALKNYAGRWKANDLIVFTQQGSHISPPHFIIQS